ncbi:BamA/TamA family outer membrane protein [Puia dinghuensis]|uniref:Membrane protein n=1 Tax=Puia dinghuensis TaxID=1792502 RepID=A0A8J2U9P8_9BACT|nr:BamA/TamA family outer membrane protein [Puia dinghuensis]GGA87900.1 membrane protein [Puia dinghuensis]
MLLSIGIISLLFSCTVPRHYQYHQPFVYAVNVKVSGPLSAGEKQDLETKLPNQLDDSLRTQIVSIAGIYRKVMYPPVFDTANIRRSKLFMVALLNSQGYYTPDVKGTYHIDTVRFKKHPERNEYRVTIDFTVNPGKQLKLDSIGFNLSTPALQELALQHRNESLLKKGVPYSKQLMSNELDRIVLLFRNNGYYYFAREDLVIIRDTVVSALIDPNLDPFQQAALLADLKKKREHPSINVEVNQRPVRDSSHITRYSIGHVSIYPDLPIILEDTVTVSNIDTSSARGFTIISRANKFRPWVLTDNVFIRPGHLYRQQNTIRTLNRFNQMGAWQQATMNFVPSDSADTVLDATLKLYPHIKQAFNVDYEVARNTNDIVTATNLFGINANIGLRNRNAFKESVLTATTLRGGVELGSDFIQTTQASISHTISFPRLIPSGLVRFLPHWVIPRASRLDSLRSLINVNASYIDRRQFFTMRSINGSFGWESTWGNRSLLLRPINIEYTQLDKTDSFNRYLQKVPSLNLAFRSGLVMSMQAVYKSFHKVGNRTDFLTLSGESSGALFGLIKQLDEGSLWRFIKGEVDYRRHYDFRRTQLAFHAYAGAGWAYGRQGTGGEETLPFYKAFFAGGPNSMRGWQVRQLGLGSSKFYDTAGKAEGTFPLDRFGDVQLEGNVEYRFPLGSIFGVKILSALYVDAGNIWDRHVLIDTPNITAIADRGSDFKFNRFYKEIAVDAGSGLRFDFEWFLIRLDYAYKIKDPQRSDHSDSWFYGLQLFKGQFQLGIGYPF